MIGGTTTLTIPTGITHNNTPGDPLSGSLSETWAKFDASGSHGGVTNGGITWGTRYDLTARGDGTDDSPSSPPDNSSRWAYTRRSFYYIDGRPTSPALIMLDSNYLTTGRAGNWGILYNVDGSVSLVINDVVVATSSAVLPLNTVFALSVWAAPNATGGARLPVDQWVVRYTTGVGGTLVHNELINVSATLSAGTPMGVPRGFSSGETTGRGSFNYYMRNLAWGWEDGDAPFGLVRGDFLDVNAIGHDNQWTVVGAAGANVDESGTGVPATGAAEEDTTTPNINQTMLETYKHSGVHYVAAGDSPITLVTAFRVIKPTSGGKGDVPLLQAILSDGTTDYIPSTQPNAGAAYQDFIVAWLDNPGGTSGWTVAQISAAHEVGLKALTTGASSGIVYKNADITRFIAYQKSGETMPALPPPPPVKRRSFFLGQAVNRSARF